MKTTCRSLLSLLISSACLATLAAGKCPQLQDSTVPINENVANEKLFHATAQGKDSVTLDVFPNTLTSNFSLVYNNVTGAISVSARGALDADVLPKNILQNGVFTITFKLICWKDSLKEFSSESSLLVQNLNDRPVEFEENPIHVNISEFHKVNSLVISLKEKAIDKDVIKKDVTYQVEDRSRHFALEGVSTAGDVFLQKPLDYDSGDHLFVINITASVSIQILFIYNFVYS